MSHDGLKSEIMFKKSVMYHLNGGPIFTLAAKSNYLIKLIEIFVELFFWCAPFGYLYLSYIFYNEPELGEGIDHGKALTPFPSRILDETSFEPTTFRS